jgi:hypothetical protein
MTGIGFRVIWSELHVTLTSESNWENAKTLLLGIVEQYASLTEETVSQELASGTERYTIFQTQLQPAVWASLNEKGTTITMRYLTEARDRRRVKSQVSAAVLSTLADHDDIQTAYPTYRVGMPRSAGDMGQ